MARSKLGEQQMKDVDVLTESEHTSTAHYFEDLVDTTTISGNNGKYLRVADADNIVEYGTGYSGIVNVMTSATTSGAMSFEHGILVSYEDL